MRLGPPHWLGAGAIAIFLHAALFLGMRDQPPGEPPSGAPQQVQVIGSASQLFGTDDRQPEEPSPALSAQTPEKISAEQPGAPAEEVGPEREVMEDTAPAAQEPVIASDVTKSEDAPRPEAVAEEGQVVTAEPADETVVAETAEIETASEAIAVPQRRPTPSQSERERISEPRRTTRTPSRQRGAPAQQASGVDRGQRRSGAPAASEQTGSGRQRASASPGQVRQYAGIVRARIARNRPSTQNRRGTAVISFAISQSGGLRYVRLARSSGDRTLDQAAIASVRRAAPFPRPPQGMSAGQLTFSIPFRFR